MLQFVNVNRIDSMLDMLYSLSCHPMVPTRRVRLRIAPLYFLIILNSFSFLLCSIFIYLFIFVTFFYSSLFVISDLHFQRKSFVQIDKESK